MCTTGHKKDRFQQHINPVDKAIKFTVEDTRPGGTVPFLDIIIASIPEGTQSKGVSRKATHRD